MSFTDVFLSQASTGIIGGFMGAIGYSIFEHLFQPTLKKWKKVHTQKIKLLKKDIKESIKKKN